MISLSNVQDLTAFEYEIAALIAQSELSEAEDRVSEAIRLAGSGSLKAVSVVPLDTVQIEGWRVLCDDLVQANRELRLRYWKCVKLMVLGLENDPGIPRLQFERNFYTDWRRMETGYIMGDGRWTFRPGSSPYLTGLEALMAVQRASPGPGFHTDEGVRLQSFIDRLLAGLLLVIRIHQIFDRAFAARGLPLAVDVVIDTLPSKPYPLDYNDLGPHTRRFIAAQTIAAAKEWLL